MAWDHKASRHQRGYGSAWDKLRKRILERDNYLCQACRQEGRLTALVVGNPRHPRAAHVDHITPKAKGGTDDEDNLQSICRVCHEAKTRRENGSRVVECGVDGWPVGA